MVTGVQVVTASKVQSIGCRWQAIRAQTLTKAMGMKGVVSRAKNRAINEDMVILTTINGCGN